MKNSRNLIFSLTLKNIQKLNICACAYVSVYIKYKHIYTKKFINTENNLKRYIPNLEKV